MKKEYKDFISLIRSIFDENYDFDISKIDLRVMFNMAKSHSMSNLIYYAFKDKNISSNIKEFIYKQHMASVYRQALISNEGKCVFKSLNDNNIEVMPLKGWYVKEYYPSEDMRPMSDIDVLFYIKDIEVHGNRKLREFFKGKVKAISIFLDVPDEILYQRLIERGESDERAKIRISRGTMERQYLADYDLVIQNYDMEKTVETIIEFINKNK